MLPLFFMKKIIHIDMDCFYASVEMRDDPSLRGKPVGIGSRDFKRGVLCTANYEARKFGVRAALPTSRALKLCKDLILVKPNFEKYKKESQKIREIFRRYTDIIEPLSLDEAYLDVSDSEEFNGSATLIAKNIRKEIFEETGLTASAGIAPNKFLAKIASDWKKPNDQFVITPSDIDKFIVDLPVKKIFGVGKVTAKKLHDLGIQTCGDLQKYSRIELRSIVGSFGDSLFNYSRGIDNRDVQVSRERKSLSVETTFQSDIEDLENLLPYVEPLFEELQERLKKKNLDQSLFKSLVVKVKFFDFNQTTVSSSSESFSLSSFRQLIIQGFERGDKPVRLIGLGVQFKTESQEDSIQPLLPFDPSL